MGTFLIILHVVVAVALILTVLLQTGKGASMGAAFGGGASSTVFGSRGSSGFMGKLTAAAAVIFMLTSLSLSLFSDRQIGGDSIMDDMTPAAQQESTTAPVVPEKPTAPVEPELPKDQAKPITPDAGENN